MSNARGNVPPVGGPGAQPGAQATEQPQRQNRGGYRGTRPSGREESQQQKAGATQKFIGKEDGLADEFVYQLTNGSKASNQYARTTEEIIRYTSIKYKQGGDVEQSLSDGTRLTIHLPVAPQTVGGVAPPDSDVQVWKMRLGLALQREALLKANLKSAYGLIRGQCSKAILEKVESQTTYTAVHDDRDPIRLLGLIKAVMYQYNTKKYRAVAIIELTSPTLISQTRYMSDGEYLKTFRTKLSVVATAGGSFTTHQGMIEDKLRAAGHAVVGATAGQIAAATPGAQARFEAALFLLKSNQDKFGRLVQELANNYNKGRDCYPTTLTEAYELMLHDDRTQDNKPPAHGNPGLNFHTKGAPVTASGAATASNSQPNPRPDITCTRCSKTGHFANKCQETKHADGTVLLCLEDDNKEEPAASGDDTALTTIGQEFDKGDLDFSFLNNGKAERTYDGESYGQHKAMTGQGVPNWWILLDNQSTVDVFSNRALLSNICKADTSCQISCNAGVVITDLIGDLPGYPNPVWFHPNGIANILLLHRVAKTCRVAYDSDGHDACFCVIKPDGTVREFCPSITGLHYCNTRKYGTVLVETVAKKKNKYTIRAYRQATLAQRIQDTIGRPSTQDFLKIVEGGLLHNCPITKADIVAAKDIFGPNLGSLQGKTVRRKTDHAPSHVADVPYDIIRLHRDVTVCFDIMFVNKMAFLVTVLRNIRFGTTERLASRNADVVGKALVRVLAFYQQRGFRVEECYGDGEFEVLRADLANAGAQLNVATKNKHVMERYIRTLKERVRACYNTMPFKQMPGMMISELVHASNYWLNMFPANDGVSVTQSPRQIMTGQQGDYRIHAQLQFGEYAQVHKSHDNTMATQTTGAIALRPTGNVQGGYYFMSLTSGARISRLAWTTLPMPAEVIDRVHILARRNPAGADIVFGWRDATEILDDVDDEDDAHDEDYLPDDDSSQDDDDDDDSAYDVGNSDGDDDDDGPPADDDESKDSQYFPPPRPARQHRMDRVGAPIAVGDADPSESSEDPAEDVSFQHDSEDADAESDIDADGASNHVDDSDENEIDADTAGMARPLAGVPPISPGVPPMSPGVGVGMGRAAARDMDDRYGPRRREGLRPRRAPRSGSKIKEPQPSRRQHALAQFNLKQGLALFGDAARDAVTKEMQQLHDRETITPRYRHELTPVERTKVLGYLMFLKEKRCGTIKGRGCADGRKQRKYKTKEETSSPTVRTELLMLSYAIDAKERQSVMTGDVPGAFMQIDIDEVVHVRLEGPLVELLTRIDPDLYEKYVTEEKGKPVLYVQLLKTLYGTVTAALLFWEDLVQHFLNEGFVANPYDKCVMNKTINGSQCTVLWHVDDIKILHIDAVVNKMVLKG